MLPFLTTTAEGRILTLEKRRDQNDRGRVGPTAKALQAPSARLPERVAVCSRRSRRGPGRSGRPSPLGSP